MTRLIDTTLPLKSYTLEDWETILEHGSFRGYNIQRLKRKLEKDPGSIGFNKETSTLTYSKNGEVKFEVPLYKIKKCNSRWSFSRFFYWIKTSLCCSEKTDTRDLAEFIHNHTKVPDSAEKLRWREYKASAMNFSTLEEMENALPSEAYNLINSAEMDTSQAQKVLLGKVVQAQELHKDTHHTFIHGQSLSYWVINQLLKELEKIKNPDKDVSLYHFLRLPGSELKRTRQEHMDLSPGNELYDFSLGTQLLSVDGSFFHNYMGESANYFVSNNSSWLSANQTDIIKKILEKYSLYSADNFDKIIDLCSEFKILEKIGHIYAVHIPKEKFADYVYRSHGYGVACKCVNDNEQVERIDNLQKHIGDHPCNNNRIPQYRILTQFLNPEETPITLHTPVSKAQKDEFKRQIRSLAEELYFQGVA